MALVRLSQKNFLAGMNPDKADLHLDGGIGECTTLKNLEVGTRPGSVVQRNGNSFFNSVSADNVTGKGLSPDNPTIEVFKVMRFYISSGVGHTIVSWKSGGSFGLSLMTGASEVVLTDVMTAHINDFAIYQDNIYMVNGTDQVYYYNGTAFSVATLPSITPNLIEVHKGRMYYSGDPTNSSTIYFSKALKPIEFNASTDFVTVFDDDGDYITSIISRGDNLHAFKSSTFYILPGAPVRAVIPSGATDVGAINNDTVQKTRYGIVFLSKRALYLYDGGAPRNISTQISPSTLRTLISSTQGVFSSAYRRDVYYLFYKLTSNAALSQGFSFDFNALEYGGRHPALSQLTNFSIQDSAVFKGDPSGDDDWVGIKAGTNNLIKLNGGTPTYYMNQANPAVPLGAVFVSKWEDGGIPWQVKELRVLYLYTHGLAETLKGEVTYEFGDELRREAITIDKVYPKWDEAIWDVDSWGSNNSFSTKLNLPAGIYANRWRLTLYTDDIVSKIDLDGYEFAYIPISELE